MESLKGKRILLTGASKGIGRALALDLARAGARLGLVARSEAELHAVQREANELGAEAYAFIGDVSDAAFVEGCAKTMETAFGGVDFLINNAGYGVFGPTESYSAEQWSDLYDTNVKGTFLFAKSVLAMMKSQQKGHIINIASDVAKRVFDGGSLYCSSKFAQDAFSAALRKEVRKDGIKVSVVYSGLVNTPFHTGGSEGKETWLNADDMSQSILFIMQQPAHVVIDELMIHPLSQDY